MASLPSPPMMGGGMGPQGGPPPAPMSPSLSNVPPGGPPPMGGNPQQAGGALPMLVFQIDQSIQSLGRALPPDLSQGLDGIRQQLREIVAQALGGGSPQMDPAAGPPSGQGPF